MTRFSSLAAASLLFSVLATTTAAAGDTTACGRTGTTLQIQLVGLSPPSPGFLTFLIDRTSTGEIEINTSGIEPSENIDCGDATTSNVDLIEVRGTAGRELVEVRGAHTFAPGASAELTGLSEIEFDVELGGSDDAFLVGGGDERDVYRLGANGVNFNADGGDEDVDVTFAPDVEFPGLDGIFGNDLLTARGGFGTGGPAVRPVVIGGSVGNDRVVGGNAGDWVLGSTGDDVILGGPGNDHVGENPHIFEVVAGPEVGLDKLAGGPGGDVLRGGPGPDKLDGGPDGDEEHGGEGDDVFLQGRRANGADHLFGGEGQDEASYEARRGLVEVSLNNKPNDGAGGEIDSVGFKGDVEDVTGGRGDDVIKGNKGPNVLEGRAGNDRLVGKAGIDTCAGGPGRDVIRTCE